MNTATKKVKTKIHSIPEVQMGYPIGAHMVQNYKAFRELAYYLFQFADADLIKTKYVSLLCRGSSGAIGASIVYQAIIEKYPHLTEIRINHVKKEGESSHSGSTDGMFPFINRDEVLYILVDDFSNTGETIKAIWAEVDYGLDQIDYIVMKYIRPYALDLIQSLQITKNIVTHTAH